MRLCSQHLTLRPAFLLFPLTDDKWWSPFDTLQQSSLKACLTTLVFCFTQRQPIIRVPPHEVVWASRCLLYLCSPRYHLWSPSLPQTCRAGIREDKGWDCLHTYQGTEDVRDSKLREHSPIDIPAGKGNGGASTTKVRHLLDESWNSRKFITIWTIN